MKLHLPTLIGPILLVGMLGAASALAIPVSRLEVRIVTGAEELSAGSSLELRIYEAGKSVRRLPLVNGEAWPRDSTHVIPVKLSDPLDPGSVVRFSLYYRSASPSAPGLEIVAADVEVPSSKESPERLLDTTLSGTIARQGELATTDRDPAALDLQERRGLRRQADVQRTRALRPALGGCRRARLREGNAGGVPRQSSVR